MGREKFEGWYTDPYRRHQARWLSDGVPTKLVRDGDSTTYDEPPEGAFVQEPEPIEFHPPRGDASDLLRADDAERGPSDLSLDEAHLRAMDAHWSDGAPLDLMWPNEGSGEDDQSGSNR